MAQEPDFRICLGQVENILPARGAESWMPAAQPSSFLPVPVHVRSARGHGHRQCVDVHSRHEMKQVFRGSLYGGLRGKQRDGFSSQLGHGQPCGWGALPRPPLQDQRCIPQLLEGLAVDSSFSFWDSLSPHTLFLPVAVSLQGLVGIEIKTWSTHFSGGQLSKVDLAGSSPADREHGETRQHGLPPAAQPCFLLSLSGDSEQHSCMNSHLRICCPWDQFMMTALRKFYFFFLHWDAHEKRE